MPRLVRDKWETLSICSRLGGDNPNTDPPDLSAKTLPDCCSGVFLNIYDVSQDSYVQRINTFLAHKLSPMKFGGMFHVGVEVDGLEWSFGHCVEGTGVCWDKPKTRQDHHFRETVEMGVVVMTLSEYAQVIRDLKTEYKGDQYHLLHRNCCHFAADMCQRLQVGKVPSWIHRLANIGERLSKCSKTVQDTASLTCASTCDALQGASMSPRVDARSRCVSIVDCRPPSSSLSHCSGYTNKSFRL